LPVAEGSGGMGQGGGAIVKTMSEPRRSILAQVVHRLIPCDGEFDRLSPSVASPGTFNWALLPE
jgi:hypothetical protein